jgi:hypothetical protein
MVRVHPPCTHVRGRPLRGKSSCELVLARRETEEGRGALVGDSDWLCGMVSCVLMSFSQQAFDRRPLAEIALVQCSC